MNGINLLKKDFINKGKVKFGALYTFRKQPIMYSLREISKDDLPFINKWRNDKEVIDLLGNNFLYIAYEVDENWYNDYLENRSRAIRLAIIQTELNCLK